MGFYNCCMDNNFNNDAEYKMIFINAYKAEHDNNILIGRNSLKPFKIICEEDEFFILPMNFENSKKSYFKTLKSLTQMDLIQLYLYQWPDKTSKVYLVKILSGVIETDDEIDQITQELWEI